MTTAVILAGGPGDSVAATQPGTINKAFVRIGGVTLVERTLRAVRTSASIERIVVVAPTVMHADSSLRLADERRPDGREIRTSLRNGLEGLPADDNVLVVASDLPVLTAAAVENFMARARATNADLGYGCVERRVHDAQFPDVPHTWARLRDGTFCGGGLVTIKPRALPHLERFIERLGAARKHPLRLAGLFGFDVLALYAIRRLSIASAERRASALLGAPVRAVISPFAETAVNVDRVSDIALAERLVRAGATSSV